MNKFFKFNWKVLVLTLVIFVVLSFVPIIPVEKNLFVLGSTSTITFIYLSLYSIINSPNIRQNFIELFSLSYIIIFIQLLLSYLISCLIFYRRK